MNNKKRKSNVLEKTSGNKKSNNGSSFQSQFLINGISPVQPDPKLLSHKPETDTQQGPGRHRSVDLKGLILELIDEIYPPLVCPVCFHTSNGRVEADQHLKDDHHGKKLFLCPSTTCEQAYSSKGGLRYHLEHNHEVTLVNKKSGLSNKKADNKKPTSVRSILSNTIHKNDSKLKKQDLPEKFQKILDETYVNNVCPSCKEVFKRKTHVVKHLVDAHNGEEPYKCIVSDCKRTKAYTTKDGLIYHLLSYHNETD